MAIRFEGNCPANVSDDAKYHIKASKGGHIEIPYEFDESDQWLLATKSHPELVAMVNQVRLELNETPGGAFYINEYKQVLVPDRKEKIYYLAGTYSEPLRFTFSDGTRDITISGEPVDLGGDPIPIGGEWKGLHHGIRYTLAAGGNDIYYTCFPRPDVKRTVKLSKEVGADAAAQIASKVKAIKGFQGGRFYVNEWREMFAPRLEDDETEYFYIGRLQVDDPWFRVRHSGG